MSILVSVVIPTFNRAHLIEHAVRSVKAQTFKNWELIVVDDGSTDNTTEVLSRMGSQIRVISQPNSGPSIARNTGVRAASGTYIAFLDSDDTWLPTKLEEQLELMDQPGVILSATNWKGKDAKDARSAFESLPFERTWICDRAPEFVSRLGGHNIMLSSWLVRRDILLAIGGFDPAADIAEDNHLLFRLSFKGKFALTKQVLLLRETSIDDVKLSRPGDLKYHRRVTRSMCLAAGTGRLLAFSHPKNVQRQFGRLYSFYLRREMELAAFDGDTWTARRRALEVLTSHPSPRDALAASIGLLLPQFIRQRERKKFVRT